MVNGGDSGCRFLCHLPIRNIRHATIHLFPILTNIKIMLIGITGGIGSGKSTIGTELRRLGFPVFDTDTAAKHLIVHNADIRTSIEQLFGEDVYDGDVYLTNKVAEQVFNNHSLLLQLNAIVHPAVFHEVELWYQHASFSSDVPREYHFVESAILYESGLDELCAEVVEITAPEEVRIARVIARDNTDNDKVRARIHAQTRPHTISGCHLPIITLLNDGNTPIPDLVQQLLRQLSYKTNRQ